MLSIYLFTKRFKELAKNVTPLSFFFFEGFEVKSDELRTRKRPIKSTNQTKVSFVASSVTELKANVGSQSKIYLRPIQKDLSTAPVVAESVSEVTEKCHGCGQDVLVRKLRKHI